MHYGTKWRGPGDRRIDPQLLAGQGFRPQRKRAELISTEDHTGVYKCFLFRACTRWKCGLIVTMLRRAARGGMLVVWILGYVQRHCS